MEPITLGRLARLTDGSIERGLSELLIRDVFTDSREECGGRFFIPLAGDKYDGHAFISDVAKRGACGCVASKNAKLGRLPDGFAVLRVKDTLSAYHALGSYTRRAFRGPVIAVTGSCGKTTTKNLIRDVVGSKWAIEATDKNENNEVGVPKTLLRVNKKTQAVVLEFGMRAKGEIAQLAGVAMPDIAVITNVEKTHIGRLGSEESIASAKAELVENMPPFTPAFLNADNRWTPWIAKRTRARISTFGITRGTIRATNISVDFQGTSFRVTGMTDKPWDVRMPLIGRANVYNALAAIAVGLELDMKPREIAGALGRVKEEHGRLNKYTLSNGTVVIDDTYNSNPASLALAIDLLSQLPWKGRRVAVVGDMLELGKYSEEEHFNIGKNHVLDKCDMLITFGHDAKHLSDGALDAGMEADMVLHYDNLSLLKRRVNTLFLPGDLVLVKGSRGMKMERITEMLVGGRR